MLALELRPISWPRACAAATQTGPPHRESRSELCRFTCMCRRRLRRGRAPHGGQPRHSAARRRSSRARAPSPPFGAIAIACPTQCRARSRRSLSKLGSGDRPRVDRGALTRYGVRDRARGGADARRAVEHLSRGPFPFHIRRIRDAVGSGLSRNRGTRPPARSIRGSWSTSRSVRRGSRGGATRAGAAHRVHGDPGRQRRDSVGAPPRSRPRQPVRGRGQVGSSTWRWALPATGAHTLTSLPQTRPAPCASSSRTWRHGNRQVIVLTRKLLESESAVSETLRSPDL